MRSNAAAAMREAEEIDRQLRAEYHRTLAGFTRDQLHAAENVARIAGRLAEAEQRYRALREAEQEIAEHPARAEIDRLRDQLSLIQNAIDEAEAEAFEAGDFSMRRALQLAKDWRETNARVEALQRALGAWTAKRRAAAPAESADDLQRELNRAQRRLVDAEQAERVRLACTANQEFLTFHPGARGSLGNL